MKRRSFFKKLGISGLVASVAPQIIQEVKAEEPRSGGYVLPNDFADEIHLFSSRDLEYLEVTEGLSDYEIDYYLCDEHRQMIVCKSIIDRLDQIEELLNAPIYSYKPQYLHRHRIRKSFDPDLKWCHFDRGIFHFENNSDSAHKIQIDGYDFIIPKGDYRLVGPFYEGHKIRMYGQDA